MLMRTPVMSSEDMPAAALHEAAGGTADYYSPTDLGYLPGIPAALQRNLHNYLHKVAAVTGTGAESCTVDYHPPMSAYLALDWRLPAAPNVTWPCCGTNATDGR